MGRCTKIGINQYDLHSTLMTTNRYIMLLISTFVYLFAFIIILMILTQVLHVLPIQLPMQYGKSFSLILLTYPIMAITTSSYLLGRAIFIPEKSRVNKALLIAVLLLAYIVIQAVFYKVYVYKESLGDWQYGIHSIIWITGLIIFPMLLARPNKFLLKLTAWAHKGF